VKKTLTTLAALLAAAGAAQAQSSVTVFGLLDGNVSHYSAGSKSGAVDETTLNDGTTNGLNGSRIGFRTTEDLGGGLKANVLMEGGLSVATGAQLQGGRAWGRQIYLGLSDATLGEFRIGRQYILEDSTMGMGNPFSNALTLNPGTGVTNVGRALPFFLNAPRVDGAITYFTPSFGGFSAAAQVTDANATSDRFYGTKLGYAAGDLASALSYEWNKQRGTGTRVNKSLTVSANYNFGSFKLLGGLQRNSDLATGSGNGAFTGGNLTVVDANGSLVASKLNGYTLGAELPMGNILWGANYTTVKYESAAGDSKSLGKLALGARYGFSKNTFAYAGLSVATGDLKDYIAQKTVTQLGLRTAF
jgi:GBP family porin